MRLHQKCILGGCHFHTYLLEGGGAILKFWGFVAAFFRHSQEFAKCLRSLEQLVFISNKLEQLKFKSEKIIGI